MSNGETEGIKPTYIMGIDTASKDKAYCLARWYNGNHEIIFTKTTKDQSLFKREIDSLCSIFNAQLVHEVSSEDIKKNSHKKYPLTPSESFSPEETIKAALDKISELQKQHTIMLNAIRDHKAVSDSSFFELRLPDEIKQIL